ncbi:MAG: DUF427 domain-containing protein [Beijerinckiaceae bacterium]|nr:DUF427 domain-containing protein [Beijerinckiaceae bacterium]
MIHGPKHVIAGPGQESVWDYPRPPRLEKVSETLVVSFAGMTIAETVRGCRVLETSHPPVYYFPMEDVQSQFISTAAGSSFCEFKGVATYISIRVGAEFSERAGWTYLNPASGFERLAGHLAFYASRVDEAWVGSEKVTPQEGNFYGGWVTAKILGPFKGRDGTAGW